MRFSILIVALVVAWGIGSGCDWQPTCEICGASKWRKFSPTNERFSVLMPSAPTSSTPTADTAFGQLSVSLFTAEPSRGYAFAVSHNRYPAELDMKDTEALLAKICKQALAGDTRLIARRAITLRGMPGSELKFQKQDKVLVTMRAYLGDHEAYAVYCVMPKTAYCQQHIDQFVDSFDLRQP